MGKMWGVLLDSSISPFSSFLVPSSFTNLMEPHLFLHFLLGKSRQEVGQIRGMVTPTGHSNSQWKIKMAINSSGPSLGVIASYASLNNLLLLLVKYGMGSIPMSFHCLHTHTRSHFSPPKIS
jgi:hypothetical protein